MFTTGYCIKLVLLQCVRCACLYTILLYCSSGRWTFTKLTHDRYRFSKLIYECVFFPFKFFTFFFHSSAYVYNVSCSRALARSVEVCVREKLLVTLQASGPFSTTKTTDYCTRTIIIYCRVPHIRLVANFILIIRPCVVGAREPKHDFKLHFTVTSLGCGLQCKLH